MAIVSATVITCPHSFEMVLLDGKLTLKKFYDFRVVDPFSMSRHSTIYPTESLLKSC